MNRLATALILFVLCIGQAVSWTYNGTEGPDEWPDFYPNCGGENQSPIDISTSAAVPANFPPMIFNHYEAIALASILENGHTVVLSLPLDFPTDQRPSIQGGGLADEYIFQQLHFHWGDDDTHGSEHTLNRAPYSAELHLVHYNSKYGTGYTDALNYPDGLAVLGIFLEAAMEDNSAFDPIIQHLQEVTHEGDQVELPEPLDFFSILPVSTSQFYRYSGSLTTPGCDEIVTWTVFATPNFLSSQQLSQFRQLTNDVGDPLVNNDRPIQPINQRTVYRAV